ncbi:MAG: hypothetical protein ACQPRH_05950 [Solitalea-like symbiont of Tyrophagus putrescentiae]
MMSRINIKIFTVFILLLSFTYWSLTILYCSPDNFIKIKFQPALTVFNQLFFQKWSFFAPPPTNNNVLYFSYIDNKGSLIATVDITNPINEAKTQNAPFNVNEQFLDYSINSSSIMINNFIAQQYKSLQIINKDGKLSNEELSKRIGESAKQLDAFKNLFNYSKIVKNKNNLLKDAKGVVIILTKQDIPKFVDRYKIKDKDYKPTTELIFNSGNIYY